MQTPNRQSDQKYVFAHLMVGNTYPYSVEDWLADVTLASDQAIDGFALNVGREDWQKDRVSDCFAAASRLRADRPFKLFFSFDMSSIPAETEEDARLLYGYVRTFGDHSSMFRYGGKVVISTFSGEKSLFGQATLDHAWRFVKESLEEIVPIYFIPSFFIDPARYRAMSSLDGAFNWNGGWPIHLKPGLPRRQIEEPKLDTDELYLRNLTGRTFMAAVSPWFFTHYGPDTWNKNWTYRGDDWLYVRRWEQLISMRDRVNIVQIISWNDYGESHYVGPIKGAQPNSQAWVNGYPHDAWLHMNRYFTRAFQKGQYPAIEKDEIFIWARPHPKSAEALDEVTRPDNWELTDDVFWVVVFAVSPCKVKLYTGDKCSRTFSVKAGMAKLSCPLKVGGGMRAKMKRAGVVVVDCNPHEFRFEGRPAVYNFNAFVAMSG